MGVISMSLEEKTAAKFRMVVSKAALPSRMSGYASRILRLALLAPCGGWMDQRVMLERPLQAAWEEQRTLLLAR